jgi:hypothetical protein
MKEKRKKNKEKETLEKSQEIERHQRVQQNLKILYFYIRKIRKGDNSDVSNYFKLFIDEKYQRYYESQRSKRCF